MTEFSEKVCGPFVENVVVQASLGISLPLDETHRLLGMFFEVKYRPELFVGLRLRIRNPPCSLTLFRSGKMLCNARSVRTASWGVKRVWRELKKLGFPCSKPSCKVLNVVVAGYVGRKVGCGVVQALFPNSVMTRFGGESLLIKEGKHSIRMFPTGKFVGVGFKSTASALGTAREVIEKIRSNYDKLFLKRVEYCKIERYNPSIEEYRKLVDKFDFSEGEKAQGEDMISTYLEKVFDGSMSMEPKSLSSGVVYCLSILFDRKHVQREIAEVAGVADVTIRNAYLKVKRVLKLQFPNSLEKRS